MFLNSLKPAVGSRPQGKRVGRGIGCTLGKTCGKGHKGQKARAGGFHKVGFEGGQMPLQRRLPKVGFTSLKKLKQAELTLSDLGKVETDEISLATLKSNSLVSKDTTRATIIKSGQVRRAVTVKGVKVTRGAREAIEAAGGKVEV